MKIDRLRVPLLVLLWLAPLSFGGVVISRVHLAHAEPPTAREFVDTALDQLEKLSIRRQEVDWDALRAEALRRIDGTSDLETAREAVRETLARIGDGHSRLLDPVAAQELKAGQSGDESGAGEKKPRQLPPEVSPSGRVLHSPDGARIGYLRVPYLVTVDPGKCDAFATRLDELQAELAKEPLKAWVVDLRRNVGGNMWPMLAGVSPILGEGVAGSVTQPGGQKMTWGTVRGAVWAMDPAHPVGKVENCRAPDSADLPVAVLIDQRTASSGEAIAVSFRGRPRTRFFGDPTAGMSSANQLVEMPDGGLLVVTTSAFSDRQDRIYGGPIAPDVSFGLPRPERGDAFPGSEGKPDPVLDAAVEWLSGQE